MVVHAPLTMAEVDACDVYQVGGANSDTFYVYDLDTIRRLHFTHRVIGAFVGTLSVHHAQNQTLGVPLCLSPEEVMLGLYHGFIRLWCDAEQDYFGGSQQLVEDPRPREEAFSHRLECEFAAYAAQKEKEAAEARERHLTKAAAKARNRGKRKRDSDREDDDESHGSALDEDTPQPSELERMLVDPHIAKSRKRQRTKEQHWLVRDIGIVALWIRRAATEMATPLRRKERSIGEDYLLADDADLPAGSEDDVTAPAPGAINPAEGSEDEDVDNKRSFRSLRVRITAPITLPCAAYDLEVPDSLRRVQLGFEDLVWRYATTSEDTQQYLHRFAAMSDLWQRGFFLGDGTKFGAHIMAYPGDPVGYHASLIVSVIPVAPPAVPMLELIATGRLGSATKKLASYAFLPDVPERGKMTAARYSKLLAGRFDKNKPLPSVCFLGIVWHKSLP
ncbi:tRNA-splicing endonuclease subunit Sen34 [Porphyridium purpureum]|uniref:tRNA-intron lyase n=1 Tax=Porphyridium purpureum TaxID=35688 RepID=A0A5J4YTF5_PORPP|nr:tRNA-splicing endonuclease subunit Sen34 [Porphyridium purpureum]|eukprot:POR1517..scf227_4